MSSKQYTPFHYTILRTPVLSPDDLSTFYAVSDVIENISCNQTVMDAIKLSSLNFYHEVTKEFSKKNAEQKENLKFHYINIFHDILQDPHLSVCFPV